MTEEITQVQIEDWKKKHGEVISYSVEDKVGYFRKPTRQEISYASVVVCCT